MSTLLGLDVGTSATRAVLIGADGRVVGVASRPHGVSEPAPGRAEHDAETAWWGETLEVLREIAERFPDEVRNLEGIGLSALGGSIVPVGDDGAALRPAILYGIDSRALPQMRSLEARLGAGRIRERTGRDLSTHSVGPKILWIRENEPKIAARARRFLPPTALLSQRLCGVEAIDPHTALAIHPLFRADRMAWDEDTAALCCRIDQLPWVCPAGTPLGPLRREVGTLTGLPAGLPVCCGTADVLAEGLACGATRPGDTVVMYGSTLFIVHITESFRPQPPLWASVYAIPGLHCVVTGTSTAGAAAQWLLEVLGRADDEAKRRLLDEARDIEAAAQGLVFLPYLRGERAPIFNPHARGVFFGLAATHTAAHLYRAVLEGIGFSLRHVLDEMGLESRRTFASGGGSDVELALQLAVDAAGKAQLRARRGRSAGYGAAVLAGLGLGLLKAGMLDEAFYGGFDKVAPGARRTQAEAGYRLYRRGGEACEPLFSVDAEPATVS